METKAKREFDPEDYIQPLSYLKASGYRLGLLVNLGGKKAEFRRLVNSPEVKEWVISFRVIRFFRDIRDSIPMCSQCNQGE